MRTTSNASFGGEVAELHGTASFLGVPRGVLEGRIDAGAVSFVTRTAETGGSGTREVTHRYLGRLSDGEFRFVMQTESASSVHAPVEFSVRRLTVLASLENR